MRNTWILLGIATLAPFASAGELSFTTVIDSRSSIDGSTLADVSQVVLQDDNGVAALVRLGVGGTLPNAVTFNPAAGNGATQVVARAGQDRATFGVSAGGTFGEFYNLAAANGQVTFATSDVLSTGGRGLFRYAYDATAPQRSTLHFAGDAIDGAHASIDTGYGLPSYGINRAGNVVFGAQTIAPTSPTNVQLIARRTGATASRIFDAATTGVAHFNLPDSYVSTRKAMTASGHAVFIGDAGDGRRIYDVAPGAPTSPIAQVRVERSLAGGTYEPMRVFAATGDAVTGTTLFQAFRDRPAPIGGGAPSDDWQQGALLVKTPARLVEIGSFDTSLPPTNGAYSPEVSAVMSENGRIAALVPDQTGGHVVYFDSAGDASPTLVAGAGTPVGEGFAIKDVAIDAASVPMVNSRGTVVFDAVIESGADVRTALLAWTPGADAPIVVAKTGDALTIGGESETIAEIAPLYPFASELAYDGDVLKDGLSETDYLAFAVRYDDGAGAAILLTHVPEPTAPLGALVSAALIIGRRRRR
jgi:hypothetical protein